MIAGRDALKIVLTALALLCLFNLASAQEDSPTPPEPSLQPTQPPLGRSWGELYFQGVYSHRDHNNFIPDLTIRQGVRTININGIPLEAYVKARILYDLNSDFWNNLAEGGVGLRYRPSNKFGLVLFSEILEGMYTGRHGEDEAPEKTYTNLLGGFAFWQWWGMHPDEIEGTRWYLPFTAWREVYADGIYNYHDNSNIISTAYYKEGFMMGHYGGTTFDAYLGFGGATDLHGDAWNNYLRLGPGFSVTPFENLDLQLSCDFFQGIHYRGEEDDRGGYNDIALTVSFSKSW